MSIGRTINVCLGRTINVRFVILAILLALFAAVIYGFAASNTIPATNAGSGSQTISGYTVSSVAYTINGTNGENLDAVGFDVAAQNGGGKPTTVKAQLAPAGSWYSCASSDETSPYTYSCATTSPQATAADATQLSVSAAQ